jgi:hypothetical protein
MLRAPSQGGGNNLHELVRAYNGQFSKDWPINLLDKDALLELTTLVIQLHTFAPLFLLGPLNFWNCSRP